MIEQNIKMQADPFKFFMPEPIPPRGIGKRNSDGSYNVWSNDPNVGAYVHPNDKAHRVFTGKKLFEPMVVRVRAKMLTHELSHFWDIAHTHDYFEGINNSKDIYGKADSSMLAQTNPDLAVQHADSFAIYTEEVFIKYNFP